jgi:hypothetical protein
LEHIEVTKETLNAFDVDEIDITALLWQTGYLTFDKEMERLGIIRYKMKIPNMEIQNSLNSLFIDYLTNFKSAKLAKQDAIFTPLENINFAEFKNALQSLFASIPYNNYVNNTISTYEGYYASVVFTFLSSLGLEVIAEDTTNRGRIDMTLKLPDYILILEFKVDSREPPLYQIKKKRYFEKYLNENKDIHMVGINFSGSDRNITDFDHQKLQ